MTFLEKYKMENNKKMGKFYGLNLDKERLEQDERDWVFGAESSKCLAIIPPETREFYLPKGEIQIGVSDFMDCATRGPLNIMESKFNFLFLNDKLSADNENWLVKNGYFNNGRIEFSDRFVAINSGTDENGNSLKAPLDAIRKQGLIPKTMLPARSDMTFNEYHDKSKITSKMYDLGKQFAERFIINYEKVKEENYEELLKQDFLNVAGFAWPEPINGEYPRIEEDPNHCFILFNLPKYYAFDNYLDEDKPNDFIKKLASNFDFWEYGYRIFITRQNDIQKQLSIIESILKDIKRILEILGLWAEKIEPVKPITEETAIIENIEESLKWDTVENIKSSIKNIAIEEKIDAELACRVAQCESGLNIKAKRINTSTSIDRGLYQWNNYYHPKITDEMAYNPETACRLFCQAVRNGKLSWWNASRSCWYVA